MQTDFLDVVVIGGGISGLGIASELATRGRQVCLFEKDTVCSKTSANSLRIIHGGVRYLQNLDFLRTIESAKAMQSLLKEYPEHIKPLTCLMPLNRTGLKSKYPAMAGIGLYRLISKIAVGLDPGGGIIDKAEALAHTGLLEGVVDYGALKWFDANLLDPAEFSNFLKVELLNRGVEINENSEVEKVSEIYTKQPEIQVKNSNQTRTYQANLVIDTSGSSIYKNLNKVKQDIAWCKAYNIILNRQLDPEVALGMKSKQGRLFFLVPRREISVLGTFYQAHDMHSDVKLSPAEIKEQDISQKLTEFNMLCPKANLSLADVSGLDLGVIPLDSYKSGEFEPLGNEKVIREGNLITVVSTKYTTFQNLARKVAAMS